MLFPLPSPLGIQPSWGTSDTTENCVLLSWCQVYGRNCSACSPLWLGSPEEVMSTTGASDIHMESCFFHLLHPDKALSFFPQRFGNWSRRRGLDISLDAA